MPLSVQLIRISSIRTYTNAHTHADTCARHFRPPQRKRGMKGVSHLTLAWGISHCLALTFSRFAEDVKQVMQLLFYHLFLFRDGSWTKRRDIFTDPCARVVFMMSQCLYKARKHLKRDFGLWVEASWGNPGHCSVKWVPVVSSECKGLCISLVCTAWSTLFIQPFCLDHMMSVCCFETQLNHESRFNTNLH